MKRYYRSHFEQVAEHEPELLQLEYECRILEQWHRNAPRVCGNAMWYGWGPYKGIRPRLVKLVGYEVKNPRAALLGGREGFDMAQGYLYYLLPDCIHDGWSCFNFGRAPDIPQSEVEVILVRADQI